MIYGLGGDDTVNGMGVPRVQVGRYLPGLVDEISEFGRCRSAYAWQKVLLAVHRETWASNVYVTTVAVALQGSDLGCGLGGDSDGVTDCDLPCLAHESSGGQAAPEVTVD